MYGMILRYVGYSLKSVAPFFIAGFVLIFVVRPAVQSKLPNYLLNVAARQAALFQILLVVILGLVEPGCRDNLRDHWSAEVA